MFSIILHSNAHSMFDIQKEKLQDLFGQVVDNKRHKLVNKKKK